MGIETMRPLIGILDDFDKPEAKMLVIIYGKQRRPRFQYLCAQARAARGFGYLSAAGVPDRFTPLARFGGSVAFTSNGDLEVTVQGPSQARYFDGQPRPWQGRATQVIEIRRAMAPMVIKALRPHP